MPLKIDLYDYFRYHKSIPHASNYPIITAVAISSTGLVTWTTDRSATSQVFYGSNVYMGQSTTQDSTLTTSHSVQLTGLTHGRTYYIKVASFYSDALSISEMYAFKYPDTLFVLKDSGGTYWTVSLSGSNGNLDSETVGSGSVDTITLTDSNGINWAVSINTAGDLITTSGASATGAVSSYALKYSNGTTWQLTVSTNGNLITT